VLIMDLLLAIVMGQVPRDQALTSPVWDTP
jgi:hypothetical protein